MFKIEQYSNEELPVINHSNDVFQEALKLDLPRIHVNNPNGDNYDLVNYKNDKLFVKKPTYFSDELFPDYPFYDLTNTEVIWLDFLRGISRLLVEEIDEYSKAIIDIILAETDIDIYILDKKADLFYEANDRIHFVDELPEYNKETDLYLVSNFNFLTGIEYGDYHKISSVPAFHYLFFKEWLFRNKDKRKVKYINKTINEVQGIGGILTLLNKQKKIFKTLGLDLIINGDKVGRFNKNFFDQYFNYDLTGKDSTEDNTIDLFSEGPIVLVPYFLQNVSLDKSVLNDKFREDLENYYNRIFGDQKVLGVLMRGSDYVIHFKDSTHKRSATVEEMIPIIRESVDRGNYDKIFLATEDKDILDRMRSEFGSIVTSISQKRYKEKHFRGGKTILDVERQKAEGAELDRLEEDTTINYLHALYILSKCAGLISSGQSNGYDFVVGLNNGEFEEVYKFNPVTDAVKEDINLENALELPERIDIYNMDEVSQRILNQFGNNDKVILEAGNLIYLSTAAFWIFNKLADELGKEIIIVNANNYIRDSFYLTGFDDLVKFI